MEQPQVPTLKNLCIQKILSSHSDYFCLPECVYNELNEKQKKLNNDLYVAVLKGPKKVGIQKIEALLACGADPNKAGPDHLNLLEKVTSSPVTCELSIVRCLLNANAIVTENSFRHAVEHSKYDVFTELQQVAPSIDWKSISDYYQSTIFHICARFAKIDFCESLLPQASLEQIHMSKNTRTYFRQDLYKCFGIYCHEEIGTVIDILRRRGEEYKKLADKLIKRDLYSFLPIIASVYLNETQGSITMAFRNFILDCIKSV